MSDLGVQAGTERLLAVPAVLEQEDAAVILDVHGMASVVELGIDVAIDVGAGDEEVELAKLGEILSQSVGLVGAHALEGCLEVGLVIALAVEEGRTLRHISVRRAQELVDVPVIAPEVRELAEILAIAQRIREVDTVDPSCRGAADYIDDDIGVGERLDQAIDPRTMHCTEELLGHAVDVDGERYAAVHDDPQTDLA